MGVCFEWCANRNGAALSALLSGVTLGGPTPAGPSDTTADNVIAIANDDKDNKDDSKDDSKEDVTVSSGGSGKHKKRKARKIRKNNRDMTTLGKLLRISQYYLRDGLKLCEARTSDLSEDKMFCVLSEKMDIDSGNSGWQKVNGIMK